MVILIQLLQYFLMNLILILIILRCLTTVFFLRLSSPHFHTEACQTSVSIACGKNDNHFSTWKVLNHFGISSNSFKLRSDMCLSMGPKKYDKKAL